MLLMPSMQWATAIVLSLCAAQVAAHASMFHPSMWGFNATDSTPFRAPGVPGEHDNRPVVPLINRTFDKWWMHGYQDLPPHPDDIMQLPQGGEVTIEIACNKVFTSYWAMAGATEPLVTDSPCPGANGTSNMDAYHTSGINDLGGCALSIAYESDWSKVKPDDLTVFSVNQTCVYERNTVFQIPEEMPPCPDGKCFCSWHWIHKEDAGSEQNYMISFQCNIQGATGTIPVAKGNPARRCGDDPALDRGADPSNCTNGARVPSYWFQFEGNNQFEDPMHPPLYTPLYGWTDGAQNDIFRTVEWTNSSDPSVSSSAPPPLSSTSSSNPISTSIVVPTFTTSVIPTTTSSASVTTSISKSAPPSSTIPGSTSIPSSTSLPTSSSIPTPQSLNSNPICLRPRPQSQDDTNQVQATFMNRVANRLGIQRHRHRRSLKPVH